MEREYYFKIVAILCISMLFLCIISFYDKEIRIGDFILQKAKIAEYFTLNDKKAISVDTITSNEKQDTVIFDTTSQRILFFGDSMLEGLCKRLKKYVAQNSHELQAVIWYSSSTKIWANHVDTLAYFISQFNPTYIFVCLGSNELFIRNLDKHNDYVKTIIKQIGDIPYIWIGPPNWKEDTGINDIILQNVGHKHFFPSKRLSYERGEDGAHPTYASAAKWMDSIAVWMNDSIKYRIAMKTPQSDEKSNSKTILLFPLK
jgi:lysophospholipase L1-like esterase